jgi:hypothetical protein
MQQPRGCGFQQFGTYEIDQNDGADPAERDQRSGLLIFEAYALPTSGLTHINRSPWPFGISARKIPQNGENVVAVRLRTVLIASAALGITALLATAAAQPYGPGAGILGPGMMTGPGVMGPWMMGRRGFGGMCNPAATGFAEWRTNRLAELIKLTDAQRTKFDEFKSASIKSAEVMRSACLGDVPETIVGRTETMEKRIDTMLQAVRTMRPALEAFYTTLSDEQKTRLDSNYGRDRFWRWRDR